MEPAQDFTWILGASSGIGSALAEELHRRGETLILSARRKEKLLVLNQSLGNRHRVLALDVLDTAALCSAAQVFQAEHVILRRVILLAADYTPMTSANLDLQAAYRIIDVNIKGALNTVHAVLPVLRQQGSGQFVLCGSVAGYRGLPGGQPYSASKAALINLAESLRVEEKPFGIDVRIINPGFVRTSLTAMNTFVMPMLLEPATAARYLADGLTTSSFEIHFPRRFTLSMKLLRCLPYGLYFRLMRRLLSERP